MFAVPNLFTLHKARVVALEVLGLQPLLMSGSSASRPLQRLSGLGIATHACTDLLSAAASGRVVGLGVPWGRRQPVTPSHLPISQVRAAFLQKPR